MATQSFSSTDDADIERAKAHLGKSLRHIDAGYVYKEGRAYYLLEDGDFCEIGEALRQGGDWGSNFSDLECTKAGRLLSDGSLAQIYLGASSVSRYCNT